MDCEMVGNYSENSGGAIFMNLSGSGGQSKVYVKASSFKHNSSDVNGGAVFCEVLDSAQMENTWEDCLFQSNLSGDQFRSGTGGAMYFFANRAEDRSHLIRTSFNSNYALSSGGAFTVLHI